MRESVLVSAMPAAALEVRGLATAAEVDVGELFALHAPGLTRVVERLTGSGALAEDLVQEAFLVAHRRRHELRGVTNLRAWLYRVCANHVRQSRRTLWRRVRLAAGLTVEPRLPVGLPDDEAARLEHARKIRRCLLQMSFAHREVLVLAQLEGESMHAIGELLDIPAGTVGSRLSAARASFRALWIAAEGAP